jgi:hypothetical protein
MMIPNSSRSTSQLAESESHRCPQEDSTHLIEGKLTEGLRDAPRLPTGSPANVDAERALAIRGHPPHPGLAADQVRKPYLSPHRVQVFEREPQETVIGGRGELLADQPRPYADQVLADPGVAVLQASVAPRDPRTMFYARLRSIVPGTPPTAPEIARLVAVDVARRWRTKRPTLA